MVVTINGTSLIKYMIAGILSLLFVFILSAALTSVRPEYRPSSPSVYYLADGIAGGAFLQMLSSENHYFQAALPEEKQPQGLSPAAFKLATSISLDDPRSLLGSELPGFSLYDTEIIVAGKGSNYTNVPVESAPPQEDLIKARKASIASLEEITKKDKPDSAPPLTTAGRKAVFLYSTHTTEAYKPLLKSNKAVDVTLVSKILQRDLISKGIGTEVSGTNVQDIVEKRNWNYARSYDASRPVVMEAMKKDKDLQYVIDIHRDVGKHTAVIREKKYAQLAFIIGGKNPNKEYNIQVAKDLHSLLEKKYPGISRGVFLKNSKGSNSLYNQDVSKNALLVEVGGEENNLPELEASAEAMADVFSTYYWKRNGAEAQ
nr:stage II sporulation protein P [Metabacillus kandeliae]